MKTTRPLWQNYQLNQCCIIVVKTQFPVAYYPFITLFPRCQVVVSVPELRRTIQRSNIRRAWRRRNQTATQEGGTGNRRLTIRLSVFGGKVEGAREWICHICGIGNNSGLQGKKCVCSFPFYRNLCGKYVKTLWSIII